jgi:hypothetical protein
VGVGWRGTQSYVSIWLFVATAVIAAAANMKREETKELINNPRDSCWKEKEALLIDLWLE